MKNINEAFTPEESKKVYNNFLAIVSDQKRRDKLVKKHGSNAEAVAYGTAVNQVKRQSSEEPKEEDKMDKTEKLKEMVKDALMNPKRSMQKEDETTEKGIIDEPISEDLDLGHTDDEPGMLKADLYRIGKYAMELYKMVDKFDKMDNEVDFPHWWQAKIIKSKDMLVSAKHYLDFETKESEIDAMVGVASEEGVIDEKLKPSMAAYLSAKDKKKVAEAIIAKLKESKGEYAEIEKEIADLKSKGKNAGDPEMQKLIKRRAELEKPKK